MPSLTELPELPPWFVWRVYRGNGAPDSYKYYLSVAHAYQATKQFLWFAPKVIPGLWYYRETLEKKRDTDYGGYRVYFRREEYTGTTVRPSTMIDKYDLPRSGMNIITDASLISAAKSVERQLDILCKNYSYLGGYPPKKLSDNG